MLGRGGTYFWSIPAHHSHRGREEPDTAAAFSWLWLLARDLGKFLILAELWLLYLERPLEDLVRISGGVGGVYSWSDTYGSFFIVLASIVNTSTGMYRALLRIEFCPSNVPVLPS